MNKYSDIKILLTDCDGVLTDTGVYYGDSGEMFKRFSIRDGMGVERLKAIAGIEVGIVTGEGSSSVINRADKLGIKELHLNVKVKEDLINQILEKKNYVARNLAYIGDDVNDLGAIKLSGLSACPSDAIDIVKESVDIVLKNKGGNGAFREFCDLIIQNR